MGQADAFFEMHGNALGAVFRALLTAAALRFVAAYGDRGEEGQDAQQGAIRTEAAAPEAGEEDTSSDKNGQDGQKNARRLQEEEQHPRIADQIIARSQKGSYAVHVHGQQGQEEGQESVFGERPQNIEARRGRAGYAGPASDAVEQGADGSHRAYVAAESFAEKKRREKGKNQNCQPGRMNGIPEACQQKALEGEEGADGQKAFHRGRAGSEDFREPHGPGGEEHELHAHEYCEQKETGLHRHVQGGRGEGEFLTHEADSVAKEKNENQDAGRTKRYGLCIGRRSPPGA